MSAQKQETIDASSSSILLRERLLRAQCASSHASRGPVSLQPRQQQKQQHGAARSATVSQCSEATGPAPVAHYSGKEIGLQTDPHIVMLTAAAKETEAEAQTDKVWDRPVSPFVALKTELVDADTQIQEGELFNFDE